MAGWAGHSLRAAVDLLVASAAVAHHRRNDRDRRRHVTGPVDAAFVVIITLAGLAWILGSAGSPVCDPASVWQLHSVWHVLGAAAVCRWAAAASASHR